MAALDQLIIRREINLARLEEQLERCAVSGAGRQAIETAISIAKVALERLGRKRAAVVMGDL
ncbi:hypothetical protein [Sphingomonas sp. TREG-RG-20F-R18-01]|uniref:hypothetical protein n=1 Tax=Sphingomonas sp. TREG-RG-20F-R18-01 TaxID=2914982 RepID=UPI001F569831|nr:hypothetical protein [Sphingomonas sp. TREG-RG-20F-R18-01]